MTDVWLSWWADNKESTIPSALRGNGDRFWIWTLGVWLIGTIVFALGRAFWSVHLVLRASSTTHGRVLFRVLRAPLLYFQQNPPGRLLNRFSSDLHRVDILVPERMFQFLVRAVRALRAVRTVVAGKPWPRFTVVVRSLFHPALVHLGQCFYSLLGPLSRGGVGALAGAAAHPRLAGGVLGAVGVSIHIATAAAVRARLFSVAFSVSLAAALVCSHVVVTHASHSAPHQPILQVGGSDAIANLWPLLSGPSQSNNDSRLWGASSPRGAVLLQRASPQLILSVGLLFLFLPDDGDHAGQAPR